MCGICGFTHLQSSPMPGRIQELVGSLRHRGPDQQGVFESGVVSLGAARLKIIDLEAGDQPIVSEDGDSVIAFNGEIYNFAELRLELERKGHRFRTHTDTETVLEAFREWDVACFSKFRGMFAVALWTESSGRLVLARDRMGIKPLYTALRNGDLYFGSELKTIFGHPEIERRLSLEALDCYLALNYVPGPWTMVEGIEKLQPGYWLEWRQGRVRSEAYWKLPFVEASNRSLDSACEELDALMRQSVKEHLVSDVPLGVWLSGGVDSSTVLHYAASAAGRRLKTFSISFQGRSFDETAYIRQAAEQYGTAATGAHRGANHAKPAASLARRRSPGPVHARGRRRADGARDVPALSPASPARGGRPRLRLRDRGRERADRGRAGVIPVIGYTCGLFCSTLTAN